MQSDPEATIMQTYLALIEIRHKIPRMHHDEHDWARIMYNWDEEMIGLRHLC